MCFPAYGCVLEKNGDGKRQGLVVFVGTDGAGEKILRWSGNQAPARINV